VASRNYKHPSIVRCEVYFDILNHLGVAYKCDGQRDRRTEKLEGYATTPLSQDDFQRTNSTVPQIKKPGNPTMFVNWRYNAH